VEALGAQRVRYVENDPDQSHWIMADPEGNEFWVSCPVWEPQPDEPEQPSPT
jgi:Glyoxalase-like domain